MNIRVFDTPHDAGIYVAALAEQVIQARPDPVLGLATGSTPIPFYDALVGLHRCGLDLSHVTTINLDEYIGLPPTHEQSYAHFMHTHLFSRTNIRPENIHIPNGMAEDLAAECARYDDVIRAHPIHLQILGIGVNGHIGFNEPDDLLLSKTHVVELRPETVRSNARFFERIEDVPRRAITMGVQAILQADQIILMAFGPEKADIIARAVLGEVRTDVPASILQLHKRVTVVLDRASAQGLFDEAGRLRAK
ncbi:MAG: glucosamine-6-phosphate deaminase [Alicyclobacillus macrosporangiidus]|uniref:glucosamine-6-phosphate deaminase n=1 Tax=Alicyclobacillus macrosporangiidus TaxID=392015 RepID=UPI0026F32B2D|nr:glucosamine-6-phosphate deaminase [Alicyclobacillus macrosporangiidus]MCL6599645.1 glucosamine-6-phosphate deaminase [Alicyclobacillus macrosporangiidus]